MVYRGGTGLRRAIRLREALGLGLHTPLGRRHPARCALRGAGGGPRALRGAGGGPRALSGARVGDVSCLTRGPVAGR